MRKRRVSAAQSHSSDAPTSSHKSFSLLAKENRGLLLDLVVFLLNLLLMHRLTGMFISIFELADQDDQLAQLVLISCSVAMWVLPATGAVLKRWSYNQRRDTKESQALALGCLFNPLLYFCLNLVVMSAIIAGLGNLIFGNKLDNGGVFVTLILLGLVLTIVQTYLIYQYFSPPKKPPRFSFLMTPEAETLGDVCLFLNMILFQVGWNLITFSRLGRVSGVQEFLGRLFFLTFIAMLIYFPPRMFYLAEDIHRRRTWLTMFLANLPVLVRVLIGSSPDRPGW
jgi:hypothetical protein